MILNERLLRVFITLAEELHFGRAAAALHMSQPALSSTLKSLERDLGTPLFNRTSRNVALTTAGGVLVVEARRLIAETQRAVALVRGSSLDVLGPLQIGYDHSMNLARLGSLIASARQSPLFGNKIGFTGAGTSRVHHELIKRNLHAAFLSGAACHPEIESVKLFAEPFAVALHPAHRLRFSKSLRLDQLQAEPVVWLCNYETFLSAFHYTPKIIQEAQTLCECLQFAREGVGVTFLPASMNPGAAIGSPIFVEFAEDPPQIEYTLAYLLTPASTGVGQFIDFARMHPVPVHVSRHAAV